MDYIVKAYKDWKLHSQFHEIVPDMDEELIFNEKQSIRDSARSLKKYGSTCCNHIRNTETLIRHNVEKTDTLQGIALKYGCTTEQIRRANRLFASDSLFLRQFLLVPVEKNSPYFPQANLNGLSNDLISTSTDDIQNEHSSTSSSSSSQSNSNSSSDTSTSSETIPSPSMNNFNISPRSPTLPTRPYSIAGELLIEASDDDPAALNNHNYHGSNSNNSSTNKQSKSLDSVAAMTPEEENRKCINDFLNKIDTTISESRKYVEKSKDKMLKSQSDDDLFVVNTDFVETRRNNQLNNSYKNNNNDNNNRQIYANHQRHSSNGSSTSDTVQLLNTTQLRRVQNSLKRLEKQQDEFFQL